MSIAIAIIGYGKIAEDQHVPAIRANPDFHLAASVSRRLAGPPGVPAFASIADLSASGLPIDAVALCNTPTERPATAFEALAAGWHVLMEKPPAATLAVAEQIAAAARAAGVSLFASWHCRFGPAVAAAKALLSGRRIDSLLIDWREDVRKWHPGQQWIWQPGGFGVFDPGINGLSLLSEILPVELAISAARLETPANHQTPIAARLDFSGPGIPANAHGLFDWLEPDDRWNIHIGFEGHTLLLSHGGSRLTLDEVPQEVGNEGEYPPLYRRFAELVNHRESEVDLRPLQLVADAFLLGERVTVPAFE
ncbi:Gfo/Idh/MocA family oxidoreductase [Sandaracinobacter neustonicus]|uniref:Gfo/Idh/MocA family oxidoreductase n=1 Tax=Sandaracinobacter neustonicus TaxID=1715348 RepID=A0A501XLL9_9SPHN|nr:Gfo/Idh/MocA family oxidoreductase [Sandaracinobacter neustonicus]TPE61572.1 Gfo/Idh/MocA family oxidoreductase [Sandaracinobacter neustonicus]